MNECEDIRLDLVAYADRELAPGARARADAHLATCGACKGELRLLEATGRLLAAYDVRGGTAPGLSGRVRDRIRREERREAGAARVPDRTQAQAGGGAAPAWRRALPWAVAAAVLLGGAGIAWRLGGGGAESPEGAPTIVQGSAGSSSRTGFVPLEPKEPLPPPSADPRRSGGALAREETRPGEGGAAPEGGGGAREGGALALGVSDGASEPGDGAPPELIAKLDMIENLELIESMDLLEAMDDPEDPTQGLDEENG